MIEIREPRESDIEGLIKLSGEFSEENEWAKNIPIGSINTKEEAYERLFGDNVTAVAVAEDNGQLISYMGIVQYEDSYGASILINKEYRSSGLGKNLVDEVFKKISKDIEVEAWVADFNKISLSATPKMGFRFREKIFEKDFIPYKEFYVHIFVRNGDKQE